MRAASHLAALVAVAAFGLAAGDLASHPSGMGAIGLTVFAAVLILALAHLYGAGGPAALRPAAERPRGVRPDGAGSGDRRVDINAASVQELARLPGVDAAAAQRIVMERVARGPFATVSDLARVRGLDPERVRTLSDHARVR